MRYFIGIDSSTTATKALLIDEQGTVVAVAATEYDFSTPQPLWSEQEPDLWWHGTVHSIKCWLSLRSTPKPWRGSG
jgi:xylulokinase